MNSRYPSDGGERRLALLVVALVATAVVMVPVERSEVTAAPAPVVGTYTGETTADGPVYRLPPMQVVAGRETGFARAQRDEQAERSREARAKAARMPSV